MVFDVETLKYPWYIPAGHLRSYAVVLDAKAVASGRLDVMAALERIPAAEIADKRAAILAILPRLQYSIGDSSDHDLETRGPDAVETALSGMLRHSRQAAAAASKH